METKYWAKRRKQQVGPFPTLAEALAAFREKFPYAGPAYAARAKKNEIMTGFGEFGPHFDIRWHDAI